MRFLSFYVVEGRMGSSGSYSCVAAMLGDAESSPVSGCCFLGDVFLVSVYPDGV